jgi:ribosomal protein L29
MAGKKVLSEKEIAKRIRDFKIELLKSPTKRGRVKKEIARLLTMANQELSVGKGSEKKIKSNSKAKSEEGKK